jgi:hypothetical protein
VYVRGRGGVHGLRTEDRKDAAEVSETTEVASVACGRGTARRRNRRKVSRLELRSNEWNGKGCHGEKVGAPVRVEVVPEGNIQKLPNSCLAERSSGAPDCCAEGFQALGQLLPQNTSSRPFSTTSASYRVSVFIQPRPLILWAHRQELSQFARKAAITHLPALNRGSVPLQIVLIEHVKAESPHDTGKPYRSSATRKP